MALPFFMTLKGTTQGNIEGYNTTAGREKEIQCHALDQTIDIPIDEKTGQPTGLRIHRPITITKSFDKASPLMYKALVTGERMSEVILKFFRIHKAGNQENFFTITMKNATIIKIKPMTYNIFDPDLQRYDNLEEVSFTYGQIEWRWEPDSISAMDQSVSGGA
jgi:type VI secretion system secreted protein Hcp